MQNSDYVVTRIAGGKISLELKREWLNLIQKIENPSFIHDVRWISAYLKSHPDTAQNCHIMKLCHRDQLIAIFALQYLTTHRFGLKLKTWQIFWPNDMGINDLVVITSPESHNYINILINYLNDNKDYPWDLLELQNIPENGTVAGMLKKIHLPRLVSVYHHDSKYLECGSTYEESVANISGKFKKNNRRKLRNLEKVGKVTTSYINTSDELKQAFEAFLDVEAANWKGEQNSALRFDEKQRQFYLELLDEYADSGKCVIHILKLDEMPIAAQFALVAGNTLFLLKIGYNAEYHAMGPGGLLLDKTLRRFSGDPVIKNISFITGAKWNDNWSPKLHRVYNYYIYNKTLKGLAAWVAEKAKSGSRKIKHKLIT